MSSYEDWSLDGWRTHLPGVTDVPGYVTRFLDHWRPSLALFIESDLWPNLIMASWQRGIPLILINGRLSERSYKRWRLMPGLIGALLQSFDLCLVRSRDDARRYGDLGASHVTIVGNLKLDVPPLPVDDHKRNELATARQYDVNPVFIVSDNGCYGTITQHHDMRYPGRPYQAATQLTNPDFALWATAFGAKGMTIHEESEVEDAIAEALSTRHQPVVVHVHSSLDQISAWRRRG